MRKNELAATAEHPPASAHLTTRAPRLRESYTNTIIAVSLSDSEFFGQGKPMPFLVAAGTAMEKQ